MELDFTLLIAPLLIFTARVCDVSIATVRVIYTIRGQKLISVVLGFFESLIFITAISGVLAGAMDPLKMLSYAGGFAAGIYVGLKVEARIASGWWVLRVIARGNADEVVQTLRDEGFAVTEVDGRGREGPVPIFFAVVRRRRAPAVLKILRERAPRAFVTVESAGSVMNAHVPPRISRVRPKPALAAIHPAESLAPSTGSPRDDSVDL